MRDANVGKYLATNMQTSNRLENTVTYIRLTLTLLLTEFCPPPD
jgi:hypothetical protein